MKIESLEEKVNLLDLIELKHKVIKSGQTYRVNPCPVCLGNDHFTIYPETNSYSSFSDCCKGGSVYKYLIEVEGMSEDIAYQELLKLAGVKTETIKKEKSSATPDPTKASEKAEPLVRNYTEIIQELYNNQTEKGKQYFLNRGLNYEVIEKYKLCVADISNLYSKYHGERAIIPIWANGEVVCWNSRDLLQDSPYKYLKAPGKAYKLNYNYINTLAPNETIVLTEGEFDALSLETIGLNSIALGGVNNYEPFINNLTRQDLIIVTAFDNDEAGQIDTPNQLKIPKEFNDINEWLIEDKEGFKTSIYKQLDDLKRPDNLYNYITNRLGEDISQYQEFKNRLTGFSNLDKITKMYPGLYVLGGLSTLGKTTFVHQLADQMAEQGEHVCFFSLEMATLELVTKSLARNTVKNNQGALVFGGGLTALQIRLNDIPKEKEKVLQRAIDSYKPTSKRFNIIEGNFNTNIFTIREYVENYIKNNNVKPVVIIDYLQIVPGDESTLNTRDKTDQIVTGLKQLSRDYNLTVIVVSSLNRSNYLTPIDFESFKESGGIEYTADVVWGLQLQAIHDEIFNSAQKVKEKREVINKAKKSNPRKIELVCLKNRNGISNYSCYFTYYPKYDLFLVDEKETIQQEELKIL